MPTPTEINLNAVLPAAPAGEGNIVWQAGTAYPDPNNPEVPLRDVSAHQPQVRRVGITIDNGSSAITTGVKGSIQVDFGGTIIGWSIEADQVGDITVEVDKAASSAPPSVPSIPNTTTDKISASAPIALSGARSAASAASGVSTWTTSVAQWDSIQFNVASASTLKRVTLYLRIQGV